MIILLDVDDVLAQFTQGVIDVLNTELNYNFDINDVTDWDMAHSLGVSNSLIFSVAGKEGFCLSLKVMPGAREGVERLKEYGDIYAVTSPILTSKTWQFERAKWLSRYFEIPGSHVIQTSAKHLIYGDVFVDDRAKHVEKWVSHQGNYRKVFGCALDVPWPRTRNDENVLYKDNWEDLLESVKAFSLDAGELRKDLSDLRKTLGGMSMGECVSAEEEEPGIVVLRTVTGYPAIVMRTEDFKAVRNWKEKP